MIDVSAAVICEGDRVLICQRPKGKSFELLWEFPGGKIEPHESAEECLVRECREELGIAIRVRDKLAEVVYDYPGGPIRLHFFEAEILSGRVVRKEHAAMKWVTADELNNFAFCPADETMLSRVDIRNVINGKKGYVPMNITFSFA
jgi:8-oxo-dGTP diphosphatase